MLNQLLRVGILFKAFLWLKPRYKVLSVTIGIIVVTWLMHSEYISYAQHSGNNGLLGVSFIIKWIITIFSVLGYLFYQAKRTSTEEVSKDFSEGDSKQQDVPSENDGFDFLRSKDRLESRADKIMRQESREGRKDS